MTSPLSLDFIYNSGIKIKYDVETIFSQSGNDGDSSGSSSPIYVCKKRSCGSTMFPMPQQAVNRANAARAAYTNAYEMYKSNPDSETSLESTSKSPTTNVNEASKTSSPKLNRSPISPLTTPTNSASKSNALSKLQTKGISMSVNPKFPSNVYPIVFHCDAMNCPCLKKGLCIICPTCGAVNHLCSYGCPSMFHVSNNYGQLLLTHYPYWPFDSFAPYRKHCINIEKIDESKLPVLHTSASANSSFNRSGKSKASKAVDSPTDDKMEGLIAASSSSSGKDALSSSMFMKDNEILSSDDEPKTGPENLSNNKQRSRKRVVRDTNTSDDEKSTESQQQDAENTSIISTNSEADEGEETPRSSKRSRRTTRLNTKNESTPTARISVQRAIKNEDSTPRPRTSINSTSEKFTCKKLTCKELIFVKDMEKVRCAAKFCPCKGQGYYIICPACSSKNHACTYPGCTLFFHAGASSSRLQNIAYEDTPAYVFQRFTEHIERNHGKQSGLQSNKQDSTPNRIIQEQDFPITSDEESETTDDEPVSNNKVVVVATKDDNRSSTNDQSLRLLAAVASEAQNLGTLSAMSIPTETGLSTFIPTFFLPIFEADPNSLDSDSPLEKKKDNSLSTSISSPLPKIMDKEATISSYKKVLECLRVVQHKWTPISTLPKSLTDRIGNRYEAILIQACAPTHIKDLYSIYSPRKKLPELSKSPQFSKFDVGLAPIEKICQNSLFSIANSFAPSQSEKDKAEKIIDFLVWLHKKVNTKDKLTKIENPSSIPPSGLERLRRSYFKELFQGDLRRRMFEIKGVLRKAGIRNFSYELLEDEPFDLNGNVVTSLRSKKNKESGNESKSVAQVPIAIPAAVAATTLPPPTVSVAPTNQNKKQIKFGSGIIPFPGYQRQSSPLAMSYDEVLNITMNSNVFSILDIDDDEVLYRNQCDAIQAIVRLYQEPSLEY